MPNLFEGISICFYLGTLIFHVYAILTELSVPIDTAKMLQRKFWL